MRAASRAAMLNSRLAKDLALGNYLAVVIQAHWRLAMDGIHDLGGMEGFGDVEQDSTETTFHARWEGRVFAMAELAGVAGYFGSVDAFRHAVERIDPIVYLTHGYYGRWLAGIEALFAERGLVRSDELQALVTALGGSVSTVPTTPANPLWQATPEPAGAANTNQREVITRARFVSGEQVATQRYPTPGHTRLPRYARGKVGRIHKCQGGWVYPDSSAHGLGECPQHLYTVAFKGAELWGEGTDPELVVHLDLFEPYLEPLTSVRNSP